MSYKHGGWWVSLLSLRRVHVFSFPRRHNNPINTPPGDMPLKIGAKHTKYILYRCEKVSTRGGHVHKCQKYPTCESVSSSSRIEVEHDRNSHQLLLEARKGFEARQDGRPALHGVIFPFAPTTTAEHISTTGKHTPCALRIQYETTTCLQLHR